jgi:V8-like Glu-specific endopeptidase
MTACGRGAHRAQERQGAPFLLVALLATLLALGVLAAPSAGAHAVARESTQQTARFWTEARMKRARPLDLFRPGRGSVAIDGPAAAAAEAPRIHPPSAGGEARASSSFETVPDPTAETTRQNGAIFIETPFGFGRCSGTSVNAPNFSVVFTAAHCIHSGGRGGRWVDFRWAFVPGYRYGQRPFGVFPAKWLDTTRQWRVSGSENYDVGAAVVGRNQDGELLGKAVGGTGIAFGLKARQVFDVHGYPAEEPFDGETQQVCTQTPFLGHDARSFLAPGPLNLAVDCDATGGASGGGWTISGGRILNSVTNYGYGDDPDTDFGAYFGDEVARLFHRAGRVK